MNTDKLIHMANQIASFFRSYPEDEAVRSIHDHLLAFWTPSMRATLLACGDREADKIDPLVAKALAILEAEKQAEPSGA